MKWEPESGIIYTTDWCQMEIKKVGVPTLRGKLLR